MSQLFYTPQNKVYAMPSQTAFRSIQRAFRTRRSARNRQAAIVGRRRATSRVPSYLRVKGTKAFQMTCQPFCLALGQGTAVTQGIEWYQLASVPTPIVPRPFSNWGLAFTLNGCVASINGLAFITAPVNNAGEYSALFDAYRIRKVEIAMYYNSNSSTTGSSPSLPVMSMANDYDDTGATSLASLQQYDSYRVIQFGNNSNNGKVMHSCTPRVGTVIEQAGGTTAIAGQAARGTWYDTNNRDVLYLGVKGNYDNMNISAATVGFVTFYVKYYVEFKNTR